MYRPQFIEPSNMKILGFDLVKDEDNYLHYVNDGTIHWNKGYSKEFPEPKEKVIIYINCNYSNEHFFIGIEQDGGTRKVYYGVCDNEIYLKLLLENIR
jgi:hypothetical protein